MTFSEAEPEKAFQRQRIFPSPWLKNFPEGLTVCIKYCFSLKRHRKPLRKRHDDGNPFLVD